MATINISLPAKLKSQAETLIKGGYYISFSDLVRDSLRWMIERNKFDLWTNEAKKDLEKGEAVVLGSKKDVDGHMGTL